MFRIIKFHDTAGKRFTKYFLYVRHFSEPQSEAATKTVS